MFDFFQNTLTPWQWGLLALVPPAIIALYFLKLKRQPLEVPSTYLWSRTIEDLHVNSLWQRLRQSLLLLLQLLLIALIALTSPRPGSIKPNGKPSTSSSRWTLAAPRWSSASRTSPRSSKPSRTTANRFAE